jgi:hypothetical protein
MADDTLPKTLTVSQALNGVTSEWRVGSPFYEDNATKFLERVETARAILVEKLKEEGASPHGLNRDRVAVENCSLYPGVPRAPRWNSLPSRIRR